MMKKSILLLVCVFNILNAYAQSTDWKLYKSENYSFLYPDTWTIQKSAEPMYDVVCVSNDRINGYNMRVSVLVEKTEGLTFQKYWQLFEKNILLTYQDHLWGTEDFGVDFLTGEAKAVIFMSDKSGRDVLYLNIIFFKDDVGYVVTLNSLPIEDDGGRYFKLFREEGLRILSSFQIL